MTGDLPGPSVNDLIHILLLERYHALTKRVNFLQLRWCKHVFPTFENLDVQIDTLGFLEKPYYPLTTRLV